MTRTRSVGIVLAAAIVAGGTFATCTQRTQQTPPADLVLRGGRIVTLDDQAPEAQALAARDGRIVAIGSNADIAGYIGSSTQVINIQFAMPGFIERLSRFCHFHLFKAIRHQNGHLLSFQFSRHKSSR